MSTIQKSRRFYHYTRRLVMAHHMEYRLSILVDHLSQEVSELHKMLRQAFQSMNPLPRFSFLIALWSISTHLSAQIEISQDVTVEKDIVYHIINEDTLLLDIFWHEDASIKEPLIVWIHGGGWRKGSKNNPREAVKLLDHGFAVASIDYRLSDQAKFPAQIMDCKAAIRWLKANGTQFNIDTSKVAVWGSSAGGHLSALIGTSWHKRDWDVFGPHQNISSKVAAVCDWYGPTDFLKMNDRPGKFDHNAPDSPEGLLVGGPIFENLEVVKAANPITHITKDTPPFLIMHGKKDELVLWEQSQMLHDALLARGVSSQLLLFENMKHGGEGWAEKTEVVTTFFMEVLK